MLHESKMNGDLIMLMERLLNVPMSVDVNVIPYYKNLKEVLISGGLNLEWEGEYPEGSFKVFKK